MTFWPQGGRSVRSCSLLDKAHASVNDAHVMVVAEFPVHRGRELLRQHGYGHVRNQSLLVFDGA